jgi:hypothetical protein
VTILSYRKRKLRVVYASATTTTPLPLVAWSSATVTNEYMSSCKEKEHGGGSVSGMALVVCHHGACMTNGTRRVIDGVACIVREGSAGES